MANQYVGNNLIELVKHLGEAQMSRQMTSCEGLITSVDQTTYMAKVMLMPWEIETGWLPIGTIAAGPGWGFFHLPPDNTEVTVDFIGGDPDNGRIHAATATTSTRLRPTSSRTSTCSSTNRAASCTSTRTAT